MKKTNLIQSLPEHVLDKFNDTNALRKAFFIESYRDLQIKLKTGSWYDLIRVSGILRQFLLEENGILNQLNPKFRDFITFTSVEKGLPGTSYGHEFGQLRKGQAHIKMVKKKDPQNDIYSGQFKHVSLLTSPLKGHKLPDFLELICVDIGKGQVFSVKNIIYLVSNFSGGVHFDPVPQSDTISSFHLGEFNPLAVNGRSIFLEKIKEIGLITVDAFEVFVVEQLLELQNYNTSNIQAEVSEIFHILSENEAKRLNFEKEIKSTKNELSP